MFAKQQNILSSPNKKRERSPSVADQPSLHKKTKVEDDASEHMGSTTNLKDAKPEARMNSLPKGLRIDLYLE